MKTITLKSNGLGRYDDVSPFMITDNQLALKIELPRVNGDFYLIANNNGKSYNIRLSRDTALTVEGLSAGEFQAEVKHYLKGILIKTYKIEPLILKESDGSLSAMPEIVELKANYAALSEDYTEYKKAAEEWQTKAIKLIYALVRFAYSDYKENVYLTGGNFDDFVKEYGFELSEKEINALKGELE